MTGTGYAAQYAPAVRDMYNNVTTCPVELLLWFHNLPWTHPMTATGGGSADGGERPAVRRRLTRKCAVAALSEAAADPP